MKYSKLFILLGVMVHFMLAGTTGKLTGIVKDENSYIKIKLDDILEFN